MSAIGDFFGKVFDLGALQQMPDLLAQLIGQVSCGPKSCLPVLRWADVAGGINTRSSDDNLFSFVTSWVGHIPSSLTGMFISMGNGLWASAAWLAKISSGMDLSATFGPMSNRLAGNIYQALTSDMLVPSLIALIAIVSGITLAWRGQGIRALTKRLTAFSVGIALFFAMGSASTGAGAMVAMPGSPWWLTQTVTGVVGQAGAGIMKTFNNGLDSAGTFLSSSNTDDKLSCRRYTAALHERSGQTDLTDFSKGVNDPILVSLNRMWEETGLRIWARSQFGDGDNGLQTFCRVLENRAGISASQQTNLTNNAAGRTDMNADALAFNPNANVTASEIKSKNFAYTLKTLVFGSGFGGEDAGSIIPDSSYEDRDTTMFDVCGINTKGDWYIRPGWSFVNSITGKNRGVPDDPSNMLAACQAALTGSYRDADYTAMTPVTVSSADAKIDAAQTAIRKDCTPGILFINPFTAWKCAGSAYGNLTKLKNSLSDRDLQQIQVRDSKIHIDPATGRLASRDGTNGMDVARIAEKFDVDENTNWRFLAVSPSYNRNATDMERQAALNTMEAQHGNMNLADAGGAFIFLLSGLVNLVIWGIGFSLLRILATVMSYLMSGLGIFLGLLLYALMPERGGRALANAAKRLGAMCATSTAIGIVAMIIVVINNALMAAFNVIDMNGNSSANVLTMGMCALLLPPASVLMLRYLCREVWRFGDPFSRQGFMRLIGGTPVMNGMGRVWAGARGIMRGTSAFAGGLLAGGGIMAAMGAAGAARRSRGDGIIASAAKGVDAGKRDAYYSKRKIKPSKADEAAKKTPPAETPIQQALSQAELKDQQAWDEANATPPTPTGETGPAPATAGESGSDKPADGQAPASGLPPRPATGPKVIDPGSATFRPSAADMAAARDMAKERTTSSGTDTLAPSYTDVAYAQTMTDALTRHELAGKGMTPDTQEYAKERERLNREHALQARRLSVGLKNHFDSEQISQAIHDAPQDVSDLRYRRQSYAYAKLLAKHDLEQRMPESGDTDLRSVNRKLTAMERDGQVARLAHQVDAYSRRQLLKAGAPSAADRATKGTA